MVSKKYGSHARNLLRREVMYWDHVSMEEGMDGSIMGEKIMRWIRAKEWWSRFCVCFHLHGRCGQCIDR